MADFVPRLIGAPTAAERMDALCEFIEFWLGPRREEYGVPDHELDTYSLPMPLRRLYQFAGRWPGFHGQESNFAVCAFSRQDSLRSLERLEITDEGRIAFLDENQGNWECSTLVQGDDPPVWCNGDFFDDEGGPHEGDKQACDSLSKFLVTFVLQEITFGSRVTLGDDALTEQFEAKNAKAIPVWEHGPYVSGSESCFYLWSGLLVANLWGDYCFGANRDEAIDFLMAHQGPV